MDAALKPPPFRGISRYNESAPTEAWQVTKAWREAAAWIARVDRVQPFHRPVHITGTIHRANRQVWDVDGAVVTIKAAIDGLRDAGVLAGDDHRYVRSVTSEWGEPDPDAPRLVLAISEVEAVA